MDVLITGTGPGNYYTDGIEYPVGPQHFCCHGHNCGMQNEVGTIHRSGYRQRDYIAIIANVLRPAQPFILAYEQVR